MRAVRIIDRTSIPTDAAALIRIAMAIEESARAFCLDWNLEPVRVKGIGRRTEAPVSSRMDDFDVLLVDKSDVPGALGYHETKPNGRPTAKVFVGDILASGGTWSTGSNSVSVCIDHEVKETLGDAGANGYAFDWRGRAWAIEACDAVQSGTFESAWGSSLSNYVLPSYFVPGSRGPWDHLGVLPGPFSIDVGGYAIVATYSETVARGTTGPRAVSLLDFKALGFDVEQDECGSVALVLDPLYIREPWKADRSSRTMQRLADGQR